MPEETEKYTNDLAFDGFARWTSSYEEGLYKFASQIVESQKREITDLLADTSFEFWVKLQLLEQHAGSRLNLCKAAGFSEDLFGSWKSRSIIPSARQQVAILSLCETIIFEWIAEQDQLQHAISVVCFSLSKVHEPQDGMLPPSFQVMSTKVDQSKLMFDPMQKVDELEWSTRVARGLESRNIRYLGELVQKKATEIHVPGYLGKKGEEEIVFVLSTIGARLGMDANSYPELKQFNIRCFPDKP